jgi:hypothetical protein
LAGVLFGLVLVWVGFLLLAVAFFNMKPAVEPVSAPVLPPVSV